MLTNKLAKNDAKVQVMNMSRLAIIADDLTGANDTGVQFAKYGLRTYVVLDAVQNPVLPDEADVVVLDTDSRASTPSQAYNKAAAVAEVLKQEQVPMVYKKIDSTLRGNLGSEIDAVLDVLAYECAAVVPAFPAIGRITAGGYHLLNQVPLACTEIARDPKAPVTDSRLVEVLKQQTKYPVGYIGLQEVLSGSDAICRAIGQALALGQRLIAFDATEQAHLVTIARAIKDCGRKIVMVGSAGLAEVLPQLYDMPVHNDSRTVEVQGNPLLIVAGSVSSVTASQIGAFLKQPNTQLVEVCGQELLRNPAGEVKRCTDTAAVALRQGRHVAIVSAAGTDAVAEARQAGRQQGMNAIEVSDHIAHYLGVIAAELVNYGVEGLFLTGGDTAVSVCRALGTSSMKVQGEVAPGIPFGYLHNGPFAGLKVVTKAGAFGTEEAIKKSMDVMLDQKGVNL